MTSPGAHGILVTGGSLLGVVGVAVLAGCAPLGDVPNQRVTSAWLEKLDTNELVVIAGGAGGDAVLVWDGPDGGGSAPVAVDGGALGLVLAMDLDLQPNQTVDLGLGDAKSGLVVRDLLGTYSGSSGGFAMVAGFAGNDLHNKAGVALSDSHFVLGVDIEGGVQWLRIRVGGDDTLDFAPADTAGDTGTWQPPPHHDTSGCGGHPATRDTSGDTGQAGDTSGRDSFPVDTGGHGQGCGCQDGSSGGCGNPSGCACSTTGFAQAPLGLVLLVGLSRRRRSRPAT